MANIQGRNQSRSGIGFVHEKITEIPKRWFVPYVTRDGRTFQMQDYFRKKKSTA